MRKVHKIKFFPIDLPGKIQLFFPPVPFGTGTHLFDPAVGKFEAIEFFRKQEYDIIIFFIKFKNAREKMAYIVSDAGLREPEHSCVYADREFICHRLVFDKIIKRCSIF